MATVIGLGVQFSANASGMTKGLSQVDRQLQGLAKQAADASRLFDDFAKSSGAAAAAQQQVATDIGFLTSAFKTGQISSEEFATNLRDIVGSAQEQAAAFAEGARVTQQVATAEEKRAAELERLGALLEAGAISEETYSRAAEAASGAKEQAAAAEREYAVDQARAAQIVEANLSKEERASRDYATAIAELDRLRDAGLIGEQDYAKAVERSAATYAKATLAASKYDDTVAAGGDAGVLKFNELSGVLSAIPGPIGNVAGRLSGLASAGEGLSRVFSGGLSQGLANIGTSVAGLINPFTAGLAAAAAFGAGATAVARGLLDLEDRVESLGNAADKLGVSFEFIQILEESANRSGVSFEQVNSATTKLLKTLAGADEESKAATAALSRLGLSLSDLEGLSAEEQFLAIGEAISGIEDPAKRTAAATALFGKSGAELLPFFNNLGPAADDIERLGGALSQVDRRRIDEFGSAIDALGVASSRLGELLLLPFVGLGEGIAQGAAEFLGGVNAIVGPIGDVLEPALSGLGVAFEIFGTLLGGVGQVIGAVLAPIGDIFQAISEAFEPLNEGAAALARWFTDGAAAATDFVMSFTPIGAIAANIDAIGEAVGRVLNIIGTAFSKAGEYISGVVADFVEFTGIGPTLEAIGETIGSVFSSITQTISSVASGIGEYLGGWLDAAEEWLGIKTELEEPVAAEFDLSQPLLAATQFNDEIGAAATAAAEFGEAGFQAALRYQNALEQIAQLQADGTFSAEEAKRAAEQAKDEFERSVDVLEQEAEAQRKAAEAAQQAADEKVAAAQRAADAQIEADKRRADSFIASQQLGGEDPATKAAEDLLAITRQIEEAEAAIVDARARGDKAAEEAAVRRLAVLDQAQSAAEEVVQFGFSSQDAQRAIDEARAELDETFTFDNFVLAPEAFRAAQEQLDQLESDLEAGIIDPDVFEEAADAVRTGFEDALKTAQKIADLNEQYAERVAEIDADRLDALAQVSQQPLQATDLRTSEGASQFLALATGRQDPAVEEYRKQLSELQKIEKEIKKLGGVVDIVGAN